MVWEIFEIYMSRILKLIGFEFSTMVGEIFEIYMSRILKLIGFEFSTMVGEIFEIYMSKIRKLALNSAPWLEIFLKLFEMNERVLFLFILQIYFSFSARFFIFSSSLQRNMFIIFFE